MKTIFTILFLMISIGLGFSQNVTIPDSNFKNALLTHDPVIDINSDGEIQVSEAEAVGDILNLGDKGISDLTGIEAFTNLIRLSCQQNNLTSLDLSANLTLQNLNAWGNHFTMLNVTQNTALTYLEISGSDLTELDITNNPNINFLSIGYNQIGELDLSQNVNLINFTSLGNPHISLDFSLCPLLEFVSIADLSSLQFVNLQNGHNSTMGLYLQEVPQLDCVRVDAEIMGNIPESWTYPEETNFSDECMMGAQDLIQNEIQIYPNPAKDQFFIRSDEQIQTVEIYSVSGEKLLSRNGRDIQSLNVSNLSKGIYLVRVKTNSGKVFSQKLIIQ